MYLSKTANTKNHVSYATESLHLVSLKVWSSIVNVRFFDTRGYVHVWLNDLESYLDVYFVDDFALQELFRNLLIFATNPLFSKLTENLLIYQESYTYVEPQKSPEYGTSQNHLLPVNIAA